MPPLDSERERIFVCTFVIADEAALTRPRHPLLQAPSATQETIRWLERDYKDRDGSNIVGINVGPLLDSLHGDPRFEALVQKVVAPKTPQ